MTHKTIAAAFVAAQKGFSPALKTSTNPHFKSRYADLSACVEAVIDALNANGIGLIQNTHEDSTGVTVETVFIHESGETISCGKLHVPASKQDPQGYGSALTYARRYSLMAACGIAPEDDDGNMASRQRQVPPAARPAPMPDKVKAAAAKIAKPKPPADPSFSVTGDTAESDLSDIAPATMPADTQTKILSAFAAIGMEGPDVEDAFGKPMPWLESDTDGLRNLLRACKAQQTQGEPV